MTGPISVIGELSAKVLRLKTTPTEYGEIGEQQWKVQLHYGVWYQNDQKGGSGTISLLKGPGLVLLADYGVEG